MRRVWEQRSVDALDWRSSWAQLAYTYTVGGRAYQGRRIAFGYRGLSRGGAEDLAARYPVGASVTVTDDPARPEQAVLEPDPAWTGLVYQLAAGAGLLLVGIVLVVALAGR